MVDIIGRQVIRYQRSGSTNEEAVELAKKGVEEGTVVLAKEQTRGRGRKERYWHSPEGGLWFSTVLYPDIEPSSAMMVTMCASIAIAQALRRISSVDACIKWPNDVMVRGKKIAGVLTEMHASTKGFRYVVVGIGINVNNPIPEELEDRAVSLKDVCDSEIDPEELLPCVLKEMDILYRMIAEGRYQEMISMWLDNTDMIGMKVRVTRECDVVYGQVSGIDEVGRLLVDVDGEVIRVVTGDVEVIRGSG